MTNALQNEQGPGGNQVLAEDNNDIDGSCDPFLPDSLEVVKCRLTYYPSPETEACLPVSFDGPDGRWWRIHSSTADRNEIPDDLFFAVANDSVCMAALRGGAHVWVKEGGA
jgi:hypothetical protein